MEEEEEDAATKDLGFRQSMTTVYLIPSTESTYREGTGSQTSRRMQPSSSEGESDEEEEEENDEEE
jgi:hypothetical protein